MAAAAAVSTAITTFFSNLFPSSPPPHPLPSSTSKPPLLHFPSPKKQKKPPTGRPHDHLLTSSSSSLHGEVDVMMMSVVCPSLAYANTLYCKSSSGYNVQVTVDENESDEQVLGRFRREVMRAGIIQECKRRRRFETPQDIKKRKTRDAAKRNSFRRRRPEGNFAEGNFSEDNFSETYEGGGGNRSAKQEVDDDNWEMLDANLPY